MNRRRLTQALYALLGAALFASNAASFLASGDALSAAFAALSLLIVAAAVAGLARPDATVLGVEVDIGEQPTWVLALLALGSVLLFAGAALRL